MMQGADSSRNGDGLHVVVTCSNRKTEAIRPCLRLGAMPGSPPISRYRKWITQLTSTDLPQKPATQMYAGEHWSIAATLPTFHPGSDTARLWVCSAGYGLIPAEAPIVAYSATFAAGHPDSVTSSTADASEWWERLSTWAGPSPGASRTLTALARTSPAATLLLVLSPPYLRACGQDILNAAAALDDPDRLIVVSVGAARTGPLADLLVTADSRLQGLFGGSKLSINVRVAAHIVRTGLRSRSQASASLTDLAQAQPRLITPVRRRLSDAEVTEYILQELSAGATASATRLLRKLRDAEFACEQHRFHQLYRDLVGGAHGRQG